MPIQRPIIRNGVGMIGQPPELTLDAEGRVSASLIQQLNGFLQSVIRKINGNLSYGNGDHATQGGNLFQQWHEVTFSATPDTEERIPHGLGKLPTGYEVCRRDRACVLYDSSIGSWNTEVMYLKCDVASATVKLRVY